MIEEDIPLKRIIVPLDGSDSSFRAAKYAIKIAKMANAEIIFVHAVVNPPYGDVRGAGVMITAYIKEARELAELWYVNAGNMASNEGVKFVAETILDVASAADSIVNFAESKKADLIVIGTKGRTGLKRLLLGSVASGVVTHASCPVLVTR
ncbi:MAG TPA: universal stress protein [Nitrososphaera sp.]|jgi:nucleotide-binding universal stress UspA family protein|nr:universal stress protein [Nitrososphaera sp.]